MLSGEYRIDETVEADTRSGWRHIGLRSKMARLRVSHLKLALEVLLGDFEIL